MCAEFVKDHLKMFVMFFNGLSPDQNIIIDFSWTLTVNKYPIYFKKASKVDLTPNINRW